MKFVRTLTGGYPRQMDYLLMLQEELALVAGSMLNTFRQDVVLAGCQVTNNNNGTVDVAPGVVYVGGNVLRFDGGQAIPIAGTHAIAQGAPGTSGPRQFEDGQTKDVYSEVKAIVVLKAGSNRELVITDELMTVDAYLDLKVASAAKVGEIKSLVFTDSTQANDFRNKFDASGLASVVEWEGWALMNGNNGTANAEGRTIVGVGTLSDVNTGNILTFNSGQAGGEPSHKLTTQEMPKHNHQTSHDGIGRNGSGNDKNTMRSSPGTDFRPNTSEAGGDQAHNNMQPWLAAFMVQKIQ